MNAEDLFLKKYGNKITASESWVIRFAEDYADQETERLKAELEKYKQMYSTSERFRLEDAANHNDEKNQDWQKIKQLQSELSELKERHMNWIKTSEQKPPREPNVRYSNPKMIVWYKGKITMLCFNHEHECWDGEDGDDYCCDIESVEYWMPLPSKPSVG